MYNCLAVSAASAKALAAAHRKPVIGVHHMVRLPPTVKRHPNTLVQKPQR